MKMYFLSLCFWCAATLCMEDMLQLAAIDYSPKQVENIFNRPTCQEVIANALHVLEQETDKQQEIACHFRLPTPMQDQPQIAQNLQENDENSCSS